MTRRAPGARGAVRTLALALALVASATACIALGGCGPEVVRIDRTGSRALRFFWEDGAGERAAYYEVASDGLFRSGGGLAARERRSNYRTTLDAEDLATFVRLLDAVSRADGAGRATVPAGDAGAGGGIRIELELRDAASGWRTVRGNASDAALEALREWCAGIALRQFDATIESLPEAGPRGR